MTTELDTQALKLALAEQTKPCPDCSEGAVMNAHGDFEWHEPCNITGVVPLIAGSRRDCPCIDVDPDIRNSQTCNPCQLMRRVHITGDSPYGACKHCNGRGWIPDLNMGKVLAWMLGTNNVVEMSSNGEFVHCCWVIDGDSSYANHSNTDLNPYKALLRACLEGVKAMSQ